MASSVPQRRQLAADIVELRRIREGAPHGAITAYEVRVGDELIGVVSQHETVSFRKVGRLIAQTYHPKRWAATKSGYRFWIRNACLYSRAEAVEWLVRDHNAASEGEHHPQ